MGGPQRIGDYDVLGELGRGGLGAVYRARNPRTGGEVAIKVLLDPSPQQRERFQIEANAAARLRHPNVLSVQDLGYERGMPFLVMELVDGGSLQDRLRHGPLPPDEAAELAAGVAAGLAEAHGQRILHRDIKPGNILLDRGRPRITDFGLARLQDVGGLTKTGSLMGTPSYAAPEQLDDASRVGPPADVYGLGATLYDMLVGEPPFGRGVSLTKLIKATLQDDPPRLHKHLPDLDGELAALCHRCLSKDPDARPTAGELEERLRTIAARLRRVPDAPAASRTPLLLAGGIVAAGLVAATILVGGSRRPSAPVASASPTESPPADPAPTEPPTLPPVTESSAADPPAEPPPAQPPPVEPSEPPPEPETRPPTPTAALTRSDYAGQLVEVWIAGDRARSLQLAAKLAEANPDDPLWLCAALHGSFDLGEEHAARKRQAIEARDRLLARGIETPLGCKLVGASLAWAGEQLDLALELHERAIEADPAFRRDDDFFRGYWKAVTLRYPDEPAERVARMRWAVDMNQANPAPNRLWNMFALAHAHAELDQIDEAFAVWDRVERENPNYHATGVYKAGLLLRVGRKDEAITALRRVVRLTQPYVDGTVSVGEAYRKECVSLTRNARAQLTKLGAEVE